MKQKAFTLIELLVVVAIIGILAAVGVVAYNGYTKSAKTNVLKSRHASILKNIGERVMWCEVSGERYFYYTDPYGSRSYLDCTSSNWGKGISLAYYFRAIHKNPYGALNGAWDGCCSGVDRNQIPTSCKANEVGYTMITSFDTPRGYFKVGTCYEEGKAPWVGELESFN
ncbi:prepilin-type N-terminal cleavage/methylation domain-containing protein [Candidatus Pelagibacter sp.]|jgi:prepilin-type N-terminal cleavage/methylation domain-containing protein|nr:prepilin-type N-terminal cleavage/methylation domain-containing protein [Candidatus Pelagibacter sp.]